MIKFTERKIKNFKQRKAFTLAELIFEITVLALLIAPTVLLLGQLTINVIEAETNSVASLLSVETAEELLKDYDFDSISADSGNFLAPYQDYSYQITTQCVNSEDLDAAAACTSGYKKVTLTVSHNAISDMVVDLLFVDIDM